MSSLRKNLANNIYRLRVERNLSQERLAEKSKISPTSISDIENAKVNVRIDYIERIAKAFGVEGHTLLINNGVINNKKRIDSKF